MLRIRDRGNSWFDMCVITGTGLCLTGCTVRCLQDGSPESGISHLASLYS